MFFFPSRNYNQRDEKTSGSKKMKLVILVGLLIVTVIALVAALTLQIAIFRREEHRELCQSEECIKTGALQFSISTESNDVLCLACVCDVVMSVFSDSFDSDIDASVQLCIDPRSIDSQRESDILRYRTNEKSRTKIYIVLKRLVHKQITILNRRFMIFPKSIFKNGNVKTETTFPR